MELEKEHLRKNNSLNQLKYEKHDQLIANKIFARNDPFLACIQNIKNDQLKNGRIEKKDMSNFEKVQ